MSFTNFPHPVRVLVVDDEPITADTLAKILTGRGYHAGAAYSAEGAIALAQTMQPHAVISDVMLPGMTGVDFGHWLDMNQPRCRLLFLSGHPAAALVLDQAAARGLIFTVLAKPAHPKEIFQFLSACASDSPTA